MPHTNNIVMLEGRICRKPREVKAGPKADPKRVPSVCTLQVYNPYAAKAAFEVTVMAIKSQKTRMLTRFQLGDWMTVVGRLALGKFKGRQKLVVYADSIGWMSNELVDKVQYSRKKAKEYEDTIGAVANMEAMMREEEEPDDFFEFMDDGWGE